MISSPYPKIDKTEVIFSLECHDLLLDKTLELRLLGSINSGTSRYSPDGVSHAHETKMIVDRLNRSSFNFLIT